MDTINPIRDVRRTLIKLPFITTSPLTDIAAVLMVWPVLWVLGVDQFITPFLAVLVLVKTLVIYNGKLAFPQLLVFPFLMTIWWLVPVPIIESGELDVFIKEYATFLSQFILLLCLVTLIRRRDQWDQLYRAIEFVVAVCVLLGLGYLIGIFDFEIRTALGYLLPGSLTSNSAFFSHITSRSLGTHENWVMFGKRIGSLLYTPSAYSTFLLIVYPLIWWKWRTSVKTRRMLRFMLLLLISASIFLTWARTSVIIHGAQLLLLFGFTTRLRQIRLPLMLLVMAAVYSGTVYLILNPGILADLFARYFVDLRSGSYSVRLTVYTESFRLFFENPIIGWGVPIKIEGISTNFSAGTHSGYLAVMVQHGVVGLLLYAGFFIQLLWKSLKNLAVKQAPHMSDYWFAVIILITSLLMRDVVSIWWWDQLIAITFWVILGLIITSTRINMSARVGIPG